MSFFEIRDRCHITIRLHVQFAITVLAIATAAFAWSASLEIRDRVFTVSIFHVFCTRWCMTLQLKFAIAALLTVHETAYLKIALVLLPIRLAWQRRFWKSFFSTSFYTSKRGALSLSVSHLSIVWSLVVCSCDAVPAEEVHLKTWVSSWKLLH